MKTSAKNVVIINASGVDDTVSRDGVVLAPTPSEGLQVIVDDTYTGPSANVKSAHGLLQ